MNKALLCKMTFSIFLSFFFINKHEEKMKETCEEIAAYSYYNVCKYKVNITVGVVSVAVSRCRPMYLLVSWIHDIPDCC